MDECLLRKLCVVR